MIDEKRIRKYEVAFAELKKKYISVPHREAFKSEQWNTYR
jgi:hypothetical protein